MTNPIFIKLAVAVLVGGIIGLEREFQYKAAGFRTIVLITIGSTLYTLFSSSIAGTTDSVCDTYRLEYSHRYRFFRCRHNFARWWSYRRIDNCRNNLACRSARYGDRSESNRDCVGCHGCCACGTATISRTVQLFLHSVRLAHPRIKRSSCN